MKLTTSTLTMQLLSAMMIILALSSSSSFAVAAEASVDTEATLGQEQGLGGEDQHPVAAKLRGTNRKLNDDELVLSCATFREGVVYNIQKRNVNDKWMYMNSGSDNYEVKAGGLENSDKFRWTIEVYDDRIEIRNKAQDKSLQSMSSYDMRAAGGGGFRIEPKCINGNVKLYYDWGGPNRWVNHKKGSKEVNWKDKERDGDYWVFHEV